MLNTRIEYRPIKQIEYNGEWYDAHEVASGIDQMLSYSGEDYDSFDALRDYEIDLPRKLLQAFVADGLINHAIGERMSKRYWVAEGKSEILRNMMMEIYDYMWNKEEIKND